MSVGSGSDSGGGSGGGGSGSGSGSGSSSSSNRQQKAQPRPSQVEFLALLPNVSDIGEQKGMGDGCLAWPSSISSHPVCQRLH